MHVARRSVLHPFAATGPVINSEPANYYRWSHTWCIDWRGSVSVWSCSSALQAWRTRPRTSSMTTSGDRLVGEIKGVEKDVLTFSTGLLGRRFQDRVGQVASIESDRQFLVETFDGKRVSGPLKAERAEQVGRAGGRCQRAVAARSRSMQPFERTFWSRFDAGPRLRVQPDARPTRPSSSRSAATSPTATSACGHAVRQCLQELAGRTRRRRSAGTSATTSAVCWARAGT